MTLDDARPSGLPARLRRLRTHHWSGVTVTQRQVAEALGASVPLISSYESDRSPAQPSAERLQAYARFFATRRSVASSPARLLDDTELTQDEHQARRTLLEELTGLRSAPAPDRDPRPTAGALGGTFFHYPDGQPVRIVASRLPDYEVDGMQYSHPWHPNAIRAVWNADADATLEVYAHVRAENPGAEVAWVTGDEVDARNLTGHVVILGTGDVGYGAGGARAAEVPPLEYFRRRLELPVLSRVPAGGDPEYDAEFTVSTDADGQAAYGGEHRESYRPRWLRDPSGERILRDRRGRRVLPVERGGYRDDEGLTSYTDVLGRERPLDGQPQLEYDVALVARQPNPLNDSATVTVLSGIFSRGTHGAAKAFTDPQLRTRNEQWVREHLDPTRFWLLTYVPVFPAPEGAQTVTPDLARPFHRLRLSD